MAEIIVLSIAAAILGFAIYKGSRRKPVGGGVVAPDEPEKPQHPIDRR